MIVKVRKIQKNEQQQLLYCNLCGAILNRMDLKNRFVISRNVGRGSEFNGSHVTMRMCCSCFDRLAEGCEVSPVGEVKVCRKSGHCQQG